MSQKGEFAQRYGIYTFLVEAARSHVFGTLEDVRSNRLVDVLNYVAYARSEMNLAHDRNEGIE